MSRPVSRFAVQRRARQKDRGDPAFAAIAERVTRTTVSVRASCVVLQVGVVEGLPTRARRSSWVLGSLLS
jgi:hypothetical protein